MSSVLPPVDQSTLPADIRSASAEVRQRYQAGLAFEHQLVSQLAQELSKTAGDDLQDSPYASLMPDALADAITGAGGLGLARDLAGLPAQVAATPTTGTTA